MNSQELQATPHIVGLTPSTLTRTALSLVVQWCHFHFLVELFSARGKHRSRRLDGDVRPRNDAPIGCPLETPLHARKALMRSQPAMNTRAPESLKAKAQPLPASPYPRDATPETRPLGDRDTSPQLRSLTISCARRKHLKKHLEHISEGGRISLPLSSG